MYDRSSYETVHVHYNKQKYPAWNVLNSLNNHKTRHQISTIPSTHPPHPHSHPERRNQRNDFDARELIDFLFLIWFLYVLTVDFWLTLSPRRGRVFVVQWDGVISNIQIQFVLVIRMWFRFTFFCFQLFLHVYEKWAEKLKVI